MNRSEEQVSRNMLTDLNAERAKSAALLSALEATGYANSPCEYSHLSGCYAVTPPWPPCAPCMARAAIRHARGESA